jgi:hypothetical protein
MIFSRSVAGGGAAGERVDRADDLRADLRAMTGTLLKRVADTKH